MVVTVLANHYLVYPSKNIKFHLLHYIYIALILVNHFYLILSKYLLKFIWPLLVHHNIFLQAAWLFVVQHLFKNFTLQCLVSKQSNKYMHNIVLT